MAPKVSYNEYHNSGYQVFLQPQGVFYSSYDYSSTLQVMPTPKILSDDDKMV